MTTATPLVPRTVLFGNPEKAGAQISPDGLRLSYLAPVDGVLNVWVGSIDGAEFSPVTDDRDRGIRSYTWAYDNRHLLYVQDKGGDENWRLHSVDLETGEVSDLTPFDDVQAQILKGSKRRPNEVLIGLNKDNPQLHDVYRLDLASRALEKIVENPGFMEWSADDDLNVRAGLAPQPDGGAAVMHRDVDQADWRPLVTFDSDDALTSGTVGFTADGRSMYLISSQGVNAGRLVSMDLATGDQVVIAEDPQYDVATVVLHPDTRQVQLVVLDRKSVV